jgi:hypothetical protein
MAFAFSQIEPETTGQVFKIPTPITSFLGASMAQGWHDSAFNSVMRMEEYHLEDQDTNYPMLSPDEANTQYGIKHHLSFDTPVRQNVAELMNKRKKAEMDREFILANGSSSIRLVPGMAASFIAGVSNPLDFGLMFLPIVGEEKMARAASIMGRGAFRQGLARGLISQEALVRAGIPAPRLAAAIIQGGVGQAAFEVPTALATWQEKGDYTIQNFLTNVGMGGLLAGGLHLGVAAAGRLFRGLRQSTRDAMLKQAMNDFLTGKDTDLSDYVHVDENAILQKVLADHDALEMEKAKQSINMDDIRQAVYDKFQEYPKIAAMMGDDGKIYTGPAHFLTNMPEHVKAVAEGFVTDKGRFVSRDEAAALVGHGGELLSEELSNETAAMHPSEESLYWNAYEQTGSKNEALNALRAHRLKISRENFFARPEVQELVDREKNQVIDAIMDKKRAEFDPSQQVNAEVQRLKEAAHSMSREQVSDHTHSEVPDGSDDAHIEKQIKSLEQDVKGVEEKEVKLPEPPKPHADAVDIALGCIIEEL